MEKVQYGTTANGETIQTTEFTSLSDGTRLEVITEDAERKGFCWPVIGDTPVLAGNQFGESYEA